MRLAIDTNVLVSGLLSPFGPPSVIVGWIAAERLRLCYDARMLTEYHDVLRRPAFPFAEGDVAALLASIRAVGELVVPELPPVALDHEADRPFLEVTNAP
ncbi:MAG: PIN domain-containing protein [Gammaproteobacteria bacterium]|nr:PIN domain-containing protein [Gammaproteobacteria bacterium]